jgi:hypothetical protein
MSRQRKRRSCSRSAAFLVNDSIDWKV